MRFKNILTYFYFCATIAVVLRTYQVFFTIDSLTGFFKPDYKGLGTVILLALGVILLSLLIVSFTVHRKPLKLPTVGYLDGGISFILGLSIFYDIMNTAPSAGIPSWQRLLLIITGVFAGIFFCLYALKCFKKFETPAITYIIPSIFWAVKLIYSFTAISSLALITNNIILLATNIFVLLFMFEFAKLANNLDANNGYKKILATGLTAVTLCAISSIPGIFAFLSKNTDVSENIPAIISTALTGLFIFRLIRTHFSGRNLKKHRRRKSKVKFMPGDGGNNFYTGR